MQTRTVRDRKVVAVLHRAVALHEVHAGAVLVCEEHELDVPEMRSSSRFKMCHRILLTNQIQPPIYQTETKVAMSVN